MRLPVLLLCGLLVSGIGAPAPARAEAASPVAGMESEQGFLSVYRDVGKARVVLGVPQLEAPMLMVSALPGALGSNDIGLDRDQQGEPRLVLFRRLGARLLLVHINTRFVALNADPAEQRAVRDAFAESVLWSGDLLNPESQQGPWLIDVSGLVASDQHGIADRLKATQQGSYSLDAARSGVLVDRARAFPDNVVFESVLTFAGAGEGAFVQQVAADPRALSLRQELSLVRLPDGQFRPRRYHPNSGSWSVGSMDFAAPLTASLDARLQPRFRLQKVHPGAAPSKVVKPIVFYLDRGTPEPVRSALLEGARWWADAFTAAGFIDAFQVEVAPADMDLSDVRYNAIVWTHRATRGWSYGGSITDPRTGEIIKGQVNLGSQRVRQDLLIAESLLAAHAREADPALKQQALDMALARLRQLAAHEVGHTLGFAHNFAASRHGNGSVLDYPHPLVQIDAAGRVSLAQAYGVGVGPWDKFLVAHGYGEFAADEEDAALARLRGDIAAQGYRYVSDADSRAAGDTHPDGLLWDIGTDAVAALKQLLAVRRVALDHFAAGALPADRQTGEFERRLVPIHLLHRYQTEAVARLLGGAEYAYGIGSDHNAGSSAVAAQRQHAALAALRDALAVDTLALPASVLDAMSPASNEYGRGPEYFSATTGQVFDAGAATAAATGLVTTFALQPARLNRLAWQHARDAAQPSPRAVLEQLVVAAWREAPRNDAKQRARGEALVQRSRNWVLLDAALQVLASDAVQAPVAADWRAGLQAFADELAGRSRDADASLAAARIRQFLDDPSRVKLAPAPVIPPGAPI